MIKKYGLMNNEIPTNSTWLYKILNNLQHISTTKEIWTCLRAFSVPQPKKPLMVMEYWSGWFDVWGEPHHVFSAQGIGSASSKWACTHGHRRFTSGNKPPRISTAFKSLSTVNWLFAWDNAICINVWKNVLLAVHDPFSLVSIYFTVWKILSALTHNVSAFFLLWQKWSL